MREKQSPFGRTRGGLVRVGCGNGQGRLSCSCRVVENCEACWCSVGDSAGRGAARSHGCGNDMHVRRDPR